MILSLYYLQLFLFLLLFSVLLSVLFVCVSLCVRMLRVCVETAGIPDAIPQATALLTSPKQGIHTTSDDEVSVRPS